MINLWPRPYQQPHPMIWITGSSDYDNIKKVASRGFVFATFLQPHDKVKLMFDAYRSTMADTRPAGRRRAWPSCRWSLPPTARRRRRRARKNSPGIWQTKTPPQFRNPPGYVGVETNVKALQGAYTGRTDAVRAKGMDYLREQGVLMYGTPDSVAKQVKRYYDLVGGFDHLLMMQQAGFLDHKRTVASMTLVRQGGLSADQGSAAHAGAEGESDGLMRQGKFISVDGLRTHYFEAGEKPSRTRARPSCCCIRRNSAARRSSPGSSISTALGQHYHVLAPDHLGFGLTDKIFDFNGQFDRRITHIRRFIEVMGVGPVHVMGSSMSGGLSLTVAARRAARLAAAEHRLLLGRRRCAQQRPAQDHQQL